MTASPTRVVADVGGTNTRIALYDPLQKEFRALHNYTNREFSQLEDIIAHWLQHLSEPKPRVCCIAVAAAPSADHVAMTNIDWSFSCSELASSFGFDQLRRLNDFEANAYALPHLTDGERELLFPGQDKPGGRLATMGPGTGLGGAFLDWHEGLPHSFACEPGHMGLAPATELELEIFRLLLPRHGNIYAELLVSGPGLVRLQQALGEIRGESTTALGPAEISRMAVAGEDRLCVIALETFCALLGSVCGDFLLANGSYGGLYLAGGIVPEITTFVRQSTFRKRLIEKGAMGETLAGIPVYAITSSQPGLLGAAHAPL
jgi:glucokinase